MTDPLRVLIVDDTPDIRMLLKAALGIMPGMEAVGEAENGDEGVRLAAELQPDAVLLDLAMPVMDGLQATPEIRRVSPATRVIILSGFSKDRLGADALAVGADAYIEKGTSPKTIADVIRQVCEAPRPDGDGLPTASEELAVQGSTSSDDDGGDESWRRRIAFAVEHVGELATAFASFARTVRSRVPFDRAGFATSDGGGFRLAAVSGIDEVRIPVGTLVTVPDRVTAALDDGATFTIHDTQDGSTDAFELQMLGAGVRSYAAVPVRAAGRAQAVISFASARPNAYTAQDVDHLEVAVREAAAAFHILWSMGRYDHPSASASFRAETEREWQRIVRHDLRSPLTVISGFAETMRSAWSELPDKDKLEFVDAISRGAKAMSTLLSDMEDADRLESGIGSVESKPIRLCSLIAQTTRDLRIGRDRTVEVTIADDLPLAFADEHDQRRVLQNLLENAFKFSEPGEPVGVDVSAADGMIQVSISDRGVGISEEDQARVFDKFERAETEATKVRGSGLGLYICRSIVEAHGGRIWIESERGIGTTVHYTIPTASSAAA